MRCSLGEHSAALASAVLSLAAAQLRPASCSPQVAIVAVRMRIHLKAAQGHQQNKFQCHEKSMGRISADKFSFHF